MKVIYLVGFGFVEKKNLIFWLKYMLNKVILFYLMYVIFVMYGKVW